MDMHRPSDKKFENYPDYKGHKDNYVRGCDCFYCMDYECKAAWEATQKKWAEMTDTEREKEKQKWS